MFEAQADADRAALTSLYSVDDFLEIFPDDATVSVLAGHKMIFRATAAGFTRRRAARSVSERYPAAGSAGRRFQTDVRPAAHRPRFANYTELGPVTHGLLPVRQRLAEPDGGRELPVRPRGGVRQRRDAMSPASSVPRRQARRSICFSHCRDTGPVGGAGRRRLEAHSGGHVQRDDDVPDGSDRPVRQPIFPRARRQSRHGPHAMPRSGSPSACWAISTSRSPTRSCRSPACFDLDISDAGACRRRPSASSRPAEPCAATKQTFAAEQGTLDSGADRSARAHAGTLPRRDPRRRAASSSVDSRAISRPRARTENWFGVIEIGSGSRRLRAVQRRRHAAIAALRAALSQPRHSLALHLSFGAAGWRGCRRRPRSRRQPHSRHAGRLVR